MTKTPTKSFRFHAARAALAGALLATIGAATAARASDASKEERMPRTYAALMKMSPVEVMHVMDSGNRGYVTREEFLKFYEELYRRMDKDHDGKLSEPEFTDRG